MLFEFDSDQRLWQDTVRDVTAKECPSTLIRNIVDNGADPGPLWKVFVGLGWTELTDPEAAVELGIVLEELGRATDPTPYLATMTQFAQLAPGVAEPDQTGAAVYSGVHAHRDADGWVLHGTAAQVLDGDRADLLAVVTDAGVFVVTADKVTATRSPVFDPALHIAEVRFEQVRVEGDPHSDVDPLRARHLALAGLALTTVGACQRVLDLALDHVKNRQQFGVTIGSFQAVQHKATDMHIAIERARALAYFATLTIAEDDPRRNLAASMAKAAAGECQSLVFRHGLQLFGAMGFTWENDLQFALKRARACEHLLGGAAEHRALITEEYRATLV
ncbi:alkylation response protein AidB-like acyl-CoA dehydrogenase [Rhodococcus sp. SMB37]|uniref:acyl-CoA dehydrogenase family protein n=1 Tax=Rhodococcus sp. SMB37 TaxID=2512213 RepID=UPI00104B58B4|nr:acyl-CoA dehydrogenase family protein [Rhodococcus sp. SMB37]TCN41387.1 alkylation response protein AidB-like acyl-CoA dehydrogenase [Rhodococcus sp. SMB37]